MSAISTRVGLRHRFDTQRDQNLTTTDPWGTSNTPDWQPHLAGEPCRATTRAVQQPVEADKYAFIEDRVIVTPRGVDIVEQDRVATVTDEAGNELFAGPMIIRGIIAYPDHLEISVEQIR